MKPRRELEIIRTLIVGAVVIAATVAAVLVVVAPVGIADPPPDLRKGGLDLLRDIVLIGFGALVGGASTRGRQTDPPEEPA